MAPVILVGMRSPYTESNRKDRHRSPFIVPILTLCFPCVLGISEGQAGLRPNHSVVDRVQKLGELFRGRNDAGLATYCSFLDAQKARDTVWRNWS